MKKRVCGYYRKKERKKENKKEISKKENKEGIEKKIFVTSDFFSKSK